MFDRQSVQHVILAKPYCTSHHAHWQWLLLSHNVKRSLTLLFILLYLIKWNGRGFPFQKKWAETEKRSGWSLKMCCVKIAQKKEKWMLGIHFFQLIFLVHYLNEVDDDSLPMVIWELWDSISEHLGPHPRGIINASVKAMESDCFT